VRPATDRVKEAVFNILQNRLNLHGASVLDLFAGSGSLGFEALSRGAARVVFVDDWNGAVRAIQENIALLHCEEQCEVVKSDVYRFLNRAVGEYDLIFVDPPYRLEGAAELPERIIVRGLVAPAGLLVMEHSARLRFDAGRMSSKVLERTFGGTMITMFARATERRSANRITS
jgi:16S rRNA (guanine966-N2)-methyltransferase